MLTRNLASTRLAQIPALPRICQRYRSIRPLHQPSLTSSLCRRQPADVLVLAVRGAGGADIPGPGQPDDADADAEFEEDEFAEEGEEGELMDEAEGDDEFESEPTPEMLAGLQGDFLNQKVPHDSPMATWASDSLM